LNQLNPETFGILLAVNTKRLLPFLELLLYSAGMILCPLWIMYNSSIAELSLKDFTGRQKNKGDGGNRTHE
jgi:hypothetical protein